jgi:hypothetical protein
MGEMAKYKGEAVKIGTCEMMYYLRYEDRNLVTAMPNNVDPMRETGLFYRLPLPEEDGFGPGNYDDYQPFIDYENGAYRINSMCRLDNSHPALVEGPDNPGMIQTTVQPLGMTISLTCYHGLSLNEDSEGIRFSWNGKRDALALSYLKDTGTELRICVSCVGCGHMWSFGWNEIEGAIINPIMKERIQKLCSDYKAQRKVTTVTAETV